jgi:hypothetical protein
MISLELSDQKGKRKVGGQTAEGCSYAGVLKNNDATEPGKPTPGVEFIQHPASSLSAAQSKKVTWHKKVRVD